MGMFDDLIPDQAALASKPAVDFSDLTPNGYRYNVLPLYQDEKGGMSLAVPGIVDSALKAAVSGLTAPADAYSGKMPVIGPNGQVSPEAKSRALDFAMTYGSLPHGFENVPGQIASQPVPTAQQLKAAATAGYDAARASSVTVPGQDIAAMAQRAQQTLQGEHGIIPKTAPKTYALLDELANPTAGAFGTYPGIEAARRGLSSIAGEGGTEGFAAQKAIPQIDSFIDAISPEAAAARQNYAAAQRANTITGDLSRGNTGFVERADARAHATHSGLNFDNNLRGRIANFLQNEDNLRGFSQDEIDALNQVVKGGPVQNAARKVGNMLGGGGGIGASAIGLGLGHYFGGPEGAEIGMLAGPSAGFALKGLENALARRSLNGVDEMIRMRSPLYEAIQQQGILAPDMGRNTAVLRALMPGLLAPAQQQQPQGLLPRSLPPAGSVLPRGLLDQMA